MTARFFHAPASAGNRPWRIVISCLSGPRCAFSSRRAVFIITTSTTYCGQFTLFFWFCLFVCFFLAETDRWKLNLKRRYTLFLYKPNVVFWPRLNILIFLPILGRKCSWIILNIKDFNMAFPLYNILGFQLPEC